MVSVETPGSLPLLQFTLAELWEQRERGASMITTAALASVGGYPTDTLAEDQDLTIAIQRKKWKVAYDDSAVAWTEAPETMRALGKQRYRWAFGAMQILKGRWNWLTQKETLSTGQRFHFLTGWFSWFADALHLVFTLLALIWTAGMIGLPSIFSLPLDLFLIPLIGFFTCKALFGIILYRVRVPCSWKDTIAASIASMALSHAIARGIFLGLWKKTGEFVRTAKSRRLRKRPSAFSAVHEELLMFIAISLGIIGMLHSVGMHYLEGKLWITILAAQAMGADFAYIGSAFIATHEARAVEGYKQMITESDSDDIVYSNFYTGIHGNYLKGSIRNAGMDPDNLPVSDPSKMNFSTGEGGKTAKAWKDIWGCGQGIGAVKEMICGQPPAMLKRIS